MKTLLLSLSFVEIASAAEESPTESNSAYGQFFVSYEEESCQLNFNPKAGASVTLFSVDDCFEWAGLTDLKKIGNLSFPAGGVAPQPKFRVYAIPTARGGNACEGRHLCRCN